MFKRNPRVYRECRDRWSSNSNPIDAGRHRAGMALVPSDRRGAGAFQVLSILDNVVAASLGRVSRFGVLSRGPMKRLAHTYLSRMNVKARSAEQKVGMLSGGNQQKVVL